MLRNFRRLVFGTVVAGIAMGFLGALPGMVPSKADAAVATLAYNDGSGKRVTFTGSDRDVFEQIRRVGHRLESNRKFYWVVNIVTDDGSRAQFTRDDLIYGLIPQ
jgi:hypothetical protein